jgi:hypothetical protein
LLVGWQRPSRSPTTTTTAYVAANVFGKEKELRPEVVAGDVLIVDEVKGANAGQDQVLAGLRPPAAVSEHPSRAHRTAERPDLNA